MATIARTLGVRNAKPRAQLHPLPFIRLAHTVMDQFIRHGGCDRLAVPLGDHRQHHVDRRRTPRAGEAVAVDLEQFISHFKLGELLAQRLLVLPMHRAAMLIEQSGLCQNMRTRADRSERHAIKGSRRSFGDQPAKLLLLHTSSPEQTTTCGIGPRSAMEPSTSMRRHWRRVRPCRRSS